VTDRYLKIVLTVIALELLWLAVGGAPARLSAQDAATPVIITGIHLDAGAAAVPVAVRGVVSVVPTGPIKVEADRPLLVESVPYSPTATPRE
jgi:hypothetical protein